MKKQKKPKTDFEWAAYRVKLNCRLGCNILEGTTTPPAGTSRTDYAIYCLLYAVESLADAIAEKGK